MGAVFHTYCAGELGWTEGSIDLIVTKRSYGEGVELAYHSASDAPAIAFLNRDNVRRLRDCPDDALSAMDSAA
ncbi:hypothetical protein Drose_06865 [Dactylosporangium roseum]|uniref:Uncharacterized protein n=1 Tax=Dactylosporangium roseum TaxID=47989 RepID=A0ABY5Z7E4_9ACTN|nr:hypothetical protein [Dactylosporangium roseum]UWZ37986.1 hypothetical protein Drose_06865 [Dactylosporangium roseum]